MESTLLRLPKDVTLLRKYYFISPDIKAHLYGEGPWCDEHDHVSLLYKDFVVSLLRQPGLGIYSCVITPPFRLQKTLANNFFSPRFPFSKKFTIINDRAGSVTLFIIHPPENFYSPFDPQFFHPLNLGTYYFGMKAYIKECVKFIERLNKKFEET